MLNLCIAILLAGTAMLQNPLAKRLPSDCATLEKAKKMGDMMYAGTAMCLVKTGEPQYQKDGMAVLKSEVERGNDYAVGSLLTLYTMGADGFAKDIPRALQMLESAVKKGSTVAKASLGSMLMYGYMVDGDPVRGEALLKEAAEAGDAGSQFNLFMGYRSGRKIPKNMERSEFYWQLLENNSDRAAAMFLEKGRQFKANEAKDVARLLEQAESGDMLAQYSLAKLYVGLGKYEEAVKWMQEAAEQDFPGALVELAKMYDQPLGVERDSVKAASLLRRAAEQGDTAAQNLLADKHFHGLGVEKSPATGLFWLKVAELLGSERGATTFRAEAAQQPAEIVAAADSKAKAYVQSHPEFMKMPDGAMIIKKYVPAAVPTPPEPEKDRP